MSQRRTPNRRGRASSAASQQRRVSLESLEDEEDSGSPTPTQQQRKRSRGGDRASQATAPSLTRYQSLSEEERSRCIREMVRRILLADANKQPVALEKLRKAIQPQGKADAQYYGIMPELLRDVRDRFKTVFGCDLVEVPARSFSLVADEDEPATQASQTTMPKAGKAAASSSGNKYVMLVGLVPYFTASAEAEAGGLVAPAGLLMVILALLHLSGGVLDLDKLTSYLHQLGIVDGLVEGADESVDSPEFRVRAKAVSVFRASDIRPLLDSWKTMRYISLEPFEVENGTRSLRVRPDVRSKYEIGDDSLQDFMDDVLSTGSSTS